jgi:predicted nucleic acid-binding protein
MHGFRVVFDACVLYSAPLRDLLMELTFEGLYKSHWTDAIHDEWIEAVLRERPDLTAERLLRTRELMDLHAEDALVRGYESLTDTLNLPDPKDRHVLAAAIHARADAIVTFNLKDFPGAALSELGIEAIHPDDFITYQFDLNMPRVCAAAKRIRARLKNPAHSAEEYVDRLQTVGLPRTAERYRQCLVLI